MKYVKRSFLAGEEFPSLASANEQVLAWVRDVADQRIHGTTHEMPAARFRKENLRPHISRPPYVLQVWQMRRVATDCLVSYDTSRHSVPWRYVHQTVELQEKNGLISIYHQGVALQNKCVNCLHAIYPSKSTFNLQSKPDCLTGFSTLPE